MPSANTFVAWLYMGSSLGLILLYSAMNMHDTVNIIGSDALVLTVLAAESSARYKRISLYFVNHVNKGHKSNLYAPQYPVVPASVHH
jgi:hypothetical protein